MDRKQVQDAYERLEQQRATSAAKQYDPDGLKGTSLERAPDVNQEFARAADPHVAPPPGATVSHQSSITSAPKHNLNPPPEMRMGPDRAAFLQQISDEQRRARELNESIKSRQEQANRERMKDEKDHD